MTPEEFFEILHNAPQPDPVSYRLYYKQDGSPIIYSMEELPGNYIQVDPATYALAPMHVRVVDQVLIHVKPPVMIKKLQPNQPAGTACDPQDVCVVVGTDQPHNKWNTVHNEIN
jgi:hypothetical protein